jgi:hypothetical protein
MLRKIRRWFTKQPERPACDTLYNLVWQRAMESSAAFVEPHMATALLLQKRRHILELAAERAPKDGMVLEFGVWKGRSINMLATMLPNRTICGFDSFEGLSEDWAGHSMKAKEGKFDQGGKLPEVEKNVTLVKGWIDETLPGFLKEHPGPIALLHIDTDTYSPCRSVLTLCRERLIPGSLILFDEFLAYPGWKNGEAKAYWEAFSDGQCTFIAFSEFRALVRVN